MSSDSRRRKAKYHPPLPSGKGIICSCCFLPVSEVSDYGRDEKGTWFTATCSKCGAKLRWYRNPDGTLEQPENVTDKDAFSLVSRDGQVFLELQ